MRLSGGANQYDSSSRPLGYLLPDRKVRMGLSNLRSQPLYLCAHLFDHMQPSMLQSWATKFLNCDGSPWSVDTAQGTGTGKGQHPGGRLQPVLMRPTPQLSFKPREGGGGGGCWGGGPGGVGCSSRGSGGGGVPAGGRGGSGRGSWGRPARDEGGGVRVRVKVRVSPRVRVRVSPRVRVRARARVRVRARVVIAVRACSPPVALLQVKIFLVVLTQI